MKKKIEGIEGGRRKTEEIQWGKNSIISQQQQQRWR